MTLGLQKGRRNASCVHHGVHEANDIGTHHQLNSESVGHGDGTQQGVTDADTAVIGHGHQRKPSAAAKNPKHPLPSIAPERHGSPPHKEVGEHPGAHDMSTKDK